MKNHIRIDQTYEFNLKNLKNCNQMEQSLISMNITSLNYIDELLDRNKDRGDQLCQMIADEVINHTAVADIMSLSAFVYKGKEKGFNVQPLIEAMNEHGEWLMKETKLLKDKL